MADQMTIPALGCFLQARRRQMAQQGVAGCSSRSRPPALRRSRLPPPPQRLPPRLLAPLLPLLAPHPHLLAQPLAPAVCPPPPFPPPSPPRHRHQSASPLCPLHRLLAHPPQARLLGLHGACRWPSQRSSANEKVAMAAQLGQACYHCPHQSIAASHIVSRPACPSVLPPAPERVQPTTTGRTPSLAPAPAAGE